MTKRKENSTNSLNRRALNDFCGVTYAIGLIGGRWKLTILYKLESRQRRFGELKQLIPNITERMLALHLKELEKDGLINRTAYAEVPPRVEYALTIAGKRLAPIWKKLEQWGQEHKVEVNGIEL